MEWFYLLTFGMDFASYISWFVDGEWCFHVSFNQRKSISVGIEVRPSFSLSQKKYSLPLIKKIHHYFQCWWIRYNKRDGTYKYEVRSITDLSQKILPHFQKYPLFTTKQKDFEKFVMICDMMKKNLHRNKQGLLKIIDIAYTMNMSWKRKYQKKDLLRFIDKMKV